MLIIFIIIIICYYLLIFVIIVESLFAIKYSLFFFNLKKKSRINNVKWKEIQNKIIKKNVFETRNKLFNPFLVTLFIITFTIFSSFSIKK